MKLKYVFDSIYSNSNTITVKSGPTTVITLSKADFDNNWSNIYGKEYEISDLDCNDLAHITINGAEAHTIEYDEETNTKWKEFAKNKFGTKHLDDYDLIMSFDKNIPLKIYNQETISTKAEHMTLVSNINNRLYGRFAGVTDLSTFDISYLDNEYSGLNSSLCKSLFKIGNPCKLPAIPKGVIKLSGCDRGSFDQLVETPFLPDSIIDISNAFQGSNSNNPKSRLENVVNFPSTIKNASAAFSNCERLTSFPFDIPEDCNAYEMLRYSGITEYTGHIPFSANISSLFSSCANLTYIKELNCGHNCSYPIAGCTKLSKIDYINVDCTKGINGSDLHLIGKPGDFNIGIMNIMNGYAVYSDAYTEGTMSVGTSNAMYPLYSEPTTAIALPYTFCKQRLCPLPTSTGADVWVDFTYNETDFVHSIIQGQRERTYNLETLNNVETFHIELSDLFQKNLSYDHELEITDIWLNEAEPITFTTAKNISNPSITMENGKVYFNGTTSNIVDGTESSVDLSGYIYYKALIDGHEFHGAIFVPNKIRINWQINEGIGVRFFIEEDEVESDEPTDDSSSEPVQNEE